MFDWSGGLALVIALVPALIRLRRTRSLLPHVDDPALPERLVGSRNLIAFAFSMALSLEIILWTRHAIWSIPLMIAVFAAAGWPLRRALFAETWSFAAYLWFYVKLAFAIYGFWIALLFSTWRSDLDGARAWAMAAILGVVLLLWNEHYGRILRFIMRARPVVTPALVDRFTAIIAKTTVIPPNIEYVDMRGGTFVNALALPDKKRPSVLFTSTLLERFDEDEVVAIFAHEVAHLEHYSPAYIKRHEWVGWLMILATVTINPLVNAVAPEYSWLVFGWPLVLLVWMIVRGNQKQKHETESDLRSAALTGDPEVMVRALIKLYEMMKLPRRIDPSQEVNASHPSLARRIQALRAATGSIAHSLPDAISFRHESTAVTLHADRLIWTEGEISSYTLAYSALDELRIEADAKGAMRLIASDPAGRKWTMPLAAEEVERAQTALNLVDTQLRPTPTAPSKWVAFGRIAAMLCVVAAAGAMQITALVAAVLAAVSFERPLVRAAGVAGLAGGGLALRGHLPPQTAWLLMVCALLLLFLDYRDKREVVSPLTWRLVAVLGGLAVLLLVPIALAGGDFLRTHQAARTWPGAIVLALAFAAATVSRASAKWRASTVAAVLIAAALTVTGSTAALDAVMADPLLMRADSVNPQPLAAVADAEHEIDFSPSEVLLSPSGVVVAATEYDGNYQARAVHVGKPGQPFKTFRGGAALFVDDRRLLVLDSGAGKAVLQLVDADALGAIWEKTIEITGGVLAIDRQGAAWQVLGYGGHELIVGISGSIATGEHTRAEWRLSGTSDESTVFPIWAAGPRLLVRSTNYDRASLSWRWFGQFGMWLAPWHGETSLLLVDGASTRELWRSSLEVNCYPGSFTDAPPICSGYDGSRTHVAALNPEDGALTPLAKFGEVASVEYIRDWLIGWSGIEPFAWHVPSRRLITIERSDSNYGGYLVSGDDSIGVVHAAVDTATIRIYRGVLGSEAIR
jgi:Zn-dependent protease with chaperone function